MRAFAKSQQARERGFSLLEMMIAVVILGVITSQMFVVLSSQKRGYASETRTLDLQESARRVIDLIAFDTRNAGMMVPREAAIASLDNVANGAVGAPNIPDRYCASETSYFNVTSPSKIWDGVGQRFAGATAAPIAGANITLDSLDIDKDPTSPSINDFAIGSGVIIARADGRASHCARITAIAGTQVTLQDAVPAAITNPPATTYIAVPAIVYEWVADNTNISSQNPGILQRNGVPISSEIEDLQVEYWVDTAPNAGAGLQIYPNGKIDGASGIEWPIHSLRFTTPAPTKANAPVVTHLARIRQVTISVVARTDIADEGTQRLARGLRPALANRAAGTVRDAFTRRVYTVNVLPRNLLDDETLDAVSVP